MKRFTFLLCFLSLWAVSYAQPDITVNTDTVRDVLPNGANSVVSFTITNNGDANLDWNIDLTDSLSDGPDVSFTKEDNTDWTLSSNQDRITNSVWITRDLTKSLFNAKNEAASTAISPEGTLWSLGSANETVPDSAFTPFVNAHGGSPQSLIGKTITLYLVSDDQYYDVEFTGYSGGGPGGGFAYTRRQMMSWFGVSQVSGSLSPAASIVINVSFSASDLASGLHYGSILINSNDPDTPRDSVIAELDILDPPAIDIQETEIIDTLDAGTSNTFDIHIENLGQSLLEWNANNPVVFTKENYADYNLKENQDRITRDVRITRKNNRGLYNIAQESGYSYGISPAGTRWAYGTTANVLPTDYTDWRSAVRSDAGIRMNNLPGYTFSLKLVEADIYYDVTFLSWQDSDLGGGFSYVRMIPFPEWLTGPMDGTVTGGTTSTVTYTMDASGLNDGIYSFDLEIRSNDLATPLVSIPVTMVVRGTPEITTDNQYNYGNVFTGSSKTYVFTVTNTGSSVLQITNVTTDSTQFSPLATNLTLQPGTSSTIPVVFTPSYVGYTRDTIRITSNDTVTPVKKIVVEGTGITPPGISLSHYSFADTLMQDSVSTDTIIMTNTGESDLAWSLSTSNSLVYGEFGFLFRFTKEANANIDLPENRDSISSGISLTGNQGGLYDYDGDPIEWAMGTTYDALSSGTPYTTDWRDAVNSVAANLPGKTLSMHIIDEDLYVDVHILLWGSRDAGNGYSYTRTAPMPSWLAAEAEFSGAVGILPPGDSENIIITHDASGLLNNGVLEGTVVLSTNIPSKPDINILNSLTIVDCDPALGLDNTLLSAALIAEGSTTRSFTITNEGTGKLVWQLDEPESQEMMAADKVVFYKFNNADWTIEENQDRITDQVWLTRADDMGIFNIAQESSYDRGDRSSPAGTEWAYGNALELSPDDYDTWYNLHNQNTPSIVGKPASLHLIEEDLYFDIMFTGWQSGNDGGGFSYVRHEPYLPVNWCSAIPEKGVVLPGESRVVTVTFDPLGKVAGTYEAQMILQTNDPDNTETVITCSLDVLGYPEIQVPVSELSFGDQFVDATTTMELTIENTGNDVLNISDISIDESAFGVTESVIEVPPYDEKAITVTFTPAMEQAYTGTMTITSDDPVNPSVDVSLSGTGVPAPDMDVNVNELSEILFTGETATRQLIITNNGAGVLDWYLGPTMPNITISKASGADYHLAENQDRITEDVWITRGYDEGLFNIARESSYDHGTWMAPTGTEWAFGTTAEATPGDYTFWRDAVRNRAGIRTHELPGYTFSLKLTDYDLFYDVTFHEWERNGSAFSYTREYAKGTLSTNWVLFSAESGSTGTGQSDTVQVVFNPGTDVASGKYSLDMAVWSNDPDGPAFIPVSLTLDDVVATDPVADTVVQEGFGSYDKDVTAVFTNGSGNPLTYSAQSSDELIATAEISGGMLTISETGIGTTDITIIANSEYGESGSQTFELRVNDIPSPNPVPDMRYAGGFGSVDFDISEAFNDSDPDVQNITAASSLEAVVTVSVTGETLTVTEVAPGVSTITLSTDDGFGGTANVSFEFRVNSAPEVANPIGDVDVDEGFTTHVIDISSVFTDADSDTLTFGASSSDENVVMVFISGTDLVIVESGTGTSTITVTASDGITTSPVSTTFETTVNDVSGLENVAQENFSVYPNPSNGKVTLTLSDVYRGDIRVAVYNNNGTQVYLNDMRIHDSNITLDLTNLSRGIYLIQLHKDDMTHYNKLIIE